MSTAENPNAAGFDVVVSKDGISTETLARFGVRPGARLHIVEEPQRRPLRGILKDVIDEETAETITRALYENKEERIAAIERDDAE